jgi:hypothetical protein
MRCRRRKWKEYYFYRERKKKKYIKIKGKENYENGKREGKEERWTDFFFATSIKLYIL